MMQQKRPVTVKLGDGVMTLKRPERSEVVVANVLGRTVSDDGSLEHFWLDRIAHKPEDVFDGWNVEGAISTILTRSVASTADNA